MAEPAEVTQLLNAYARGDQRAFGRVVPLVYNELRRIARNHLRRAQRGVTLDTTGLVHEAYFKLAGQQGTKLENRGHFLAVSAQRNWKRARAWIRAELSDDFQVKQGR